MSEWIEWAGGEQPAGRQDRVEVRFRDGTQDNGPSGIYGWDHDGEDGDIIAYRVVKEKEE